ncbi:hypothetical protein TVAG_284510 [Trichomonas vaginalis G3]|uniref:Uncharacterized protein n=1 Tax=Trichomonas vaginalis (strain ATCC PRA-98 / G3) TaxID=412133 RepID=A2ENA9_TRIV3|nr:hypothetical protein TVAGG3_0356750 [Trichomonas vaginalis G3]EAY05868.1 hypothetical protein TVAG_284510 [Trichomonas vaginalis G3]KAI5531677.1 hypothetical protein TVAGG3_0356750 [Trichomonas vaginalis G3]|eukprot:XP_001318091.1 hypothetical protein [Trichomonas vaginalis G3]
MEIKPIPVEVCNPTNKSTINTSERCCTLSFQLLSSNGMTDSENLQHQEVQNSRNLTQPITKTEIDENSRKNNSTKIKPSQKSNIQQRNNKSMCTEPCQNSYYYASKYQHIQPKRIGKSKIKKFVKCEITQTSDIIFESSESKNTEIQNDISKDSSAFQADLTSTKINDGVFLTENDLTTDTEFQVNKSFSFQQEDDVEYNTLEDTTAVISEPTNSDYLEDDVISAADSTQGMNYLTDESENYRENIIFDKTKVSFVSDEIELAPGQLSPPIKLMNQLVDDDRELQPEDLGIWLRNL